MAVEKIKKTSRKENQFVLSTCNLRFGKGQMFIVSAVIIIFSLVSLSNLLGIYKSVEEARVQESLILDRQLKNIKGEYEAIAAAARLSDNVNGSAIRYLANFSELLRSTAGIEILYSFVYFNGTSKNYSVTVGNYLRDSINATINVSNSITNGAVVGVVDDRKNSTRTFESSISSGTINVNITYVIRNENVIEAVPVTVSARNYVSLFYDIKLVEGQDFVRIKDVYNVTW